MIPLDGLPPHGVILPADGSPLPAWEDGEHSPFSEQVLDLFARGELTLWRWRPLTNDLLIAGQFEGTSVEDWMSRIHPRDQLRFSEFLDTGSAGGDFNGSLDYRIREPDQPDWTNIRHTGLFRDHPHPELYCLIERVLDRGPNPSTSLDEMEGSLQASPSYVHRHVRELLRIDCDARRWKDVARVAGGLIGAEWIVLFQRENGTDPFHEQTRWPERIHSLGTLEGEAIPRLFSSREFFHCPLPGRIARENSLPLTPETTALHFLPSDDGSCYGFALAGFQGPPAPSRFPTIETGLALLCALAAHRIERRHGTKEYRKLEEVLRHSQRLEGVGRLSGGTAHDFNNLLTVIRGHVDMLESSREKWDEATRDSIDTIRVAAERASDLTRQLLAFSRSESEGFQACDINALLQEFAGMLKRMVEETVTFHIESAPNLPPVKGDHSMLGQVLMNLVVNARDAMPGGGDITLRTALCHRASAEGSTESPWVSFSVEDTGTGIPEDKLDRIFEPFFTTKASGKGTGLGLSTVREIVQRHGGFVEVRNGKPHGATFTVFLPPGEVSSLPPEENHQHRNYADLCQHATILLVEDEKSVRMMIRKMLERNGCDVMEAVSGKDAIDRWPGVSLVVTDVVMPDGVNGWEMSRTLRASRPGLPIIVTSGYFEDPANHDFENDRSLRFLQKPYSMEDLRDTVGELLALDETSARSGDG